MCGIAGVWSKNSSNLAVIHKMTEIQKHRGPDGEGHIVVGESTRKFDAEAGELRLGDFLALGHRRLAIVETSMAGAQPMSTADGQLWIAFNGEIYNHVELRNELRQKGYQFASNSDTEVVLIAYREWGVGCFSRFNGMWGIAIWDESKKSLVLSRDRMGVKPLYYFADSNNLLFSSEIKAILSTDLVARKINMRLAIDYLKWSMVNHKNETFFEDIKAFPPGHYAIINSIEDKLNLVKYWDVRLGSGNNSPTNDVMQNILRFRQLFKDSVSLRLRSDVPVGSCLSGGLDSSAIVCQAAELRKKEDGDFHTFNAASDDPRFDERVWCDIANAKAGGKSHYCIPTAEGFIHDLPALLWHQEEPFTTASIYAQWLVMRDAKNARIPVLLDGQGADELLCGYRKFVYFHIREMMQSKQWIKLIKFIVHLFVNGDRGLLRWREGIRYLPKFLRRNIPDLKKVLTPTGENIWNESGGYFDKSKSIIDHQIDDLQKYSVPSLLRYEDRNSMAWSIESRVPFLDYRLTEFLISVPVDAKLEGGRTKAIMRHALRGIVPDEILDRRDKVGFVTAQEEWIRGPLRPYIERCFVAENFPLAEWVDSKILLEKYRNLIAGHSSISHGEIFRVFILAEWMKKFRVSL